MNEEREINEAVQATLDAVDALCWNLYGNTARDFRDHFGIVDPRFEEEPRLTTEEIVDRYARVPDSIIAELPSAGRFWELHEVPEFMMECPWSRAVGVMIDCYGEREPDRAAAILRGIIADPSSMPCGIAASTMVSEELSATATSELVAAAAWFDQWPPDFQHEYLSAYEGLLPPETVRRLRG